MLRWINAVDAIPAAPQRRTVMISAGHSDSDPGAAAHGYTEAGIVLEFRELVSNALARLGIKHMTDGQPGMNLPLRQAVQVARTQQIAVEFHCNAARPQATGTETLSQPRHYGLGAQLCHATADALGIANRGAKPEDSGQHSRLAFVSDGGGLIHELFFLTSKTDLAAYIAGKRGLAQEVARVIAEAARHAPDE
ncbi:putative N-acetylmuramoyl-L-alanine [Halomonas phage QHHSV-1]|nr:putative N-acetylmuramoyl-L-alanine [Halomonas phage QHHSV-1]